MEYANIVLNDDSKPRGHDGNRMFGCLHFVNMTPEWNLLLGSGTYESKSILTCMSAPVGVQVDAPMVEILSARMARTWAASFHRSHKSSLAAHVTEAATAEVPSASSADVPVPATEGKAVPCR